MKQCIIYLLLREGNADSKFYSSQSSALIIRTRCNIMQYLFNKISERHVILKGNVFIYILDSLNKQLLWKISKFYKMSGSILNHPLLCNSQCGGLNWILSTQTFLCAEKLQRRNAIQMKRFETQGNALRTFRHFIFSVKKYFFIFSGSSYRKSLNSRQTFKLFWRCF